MSHKQRCIALFSCEAEFMSATSYQGIWLRNLLSQINDMYTGSLVLYIDNKSAIDLAYELIKAFVMDATKI